MLKPDALMQDKVNNHSLSPGVTKCTLHIALLAKTWPLPFHLAWVLDSS